MSRTEPKERAAAMILAAGLGTRLRPLTLELPKPLVWLGDRPLLAHVAARLARAGVSRAVVNTHHRADAFTPALLDALALSVSVLHEPAILGTAGGVANAARELGDGDVIVWNGDILADVDLRELRSRHAKGGALATLCVAPRACGEGTVGVNAAGDVVRLRGEAFGTEVRGGDFLGIQLLGAELRGELPRVGCLVGDVYVPALRRGARIGTAPFRGEWDDIGSLPSYLAASARWLAATGAREYVAPDAVVAAGVDATGSVVGAGATVVGRGRLRGCIVWPRARAEAPLDNAVVTTGGRVVAVA